MPLLKIELELVEAPCMTTPSDRRDFIFDESYYEPNMRFTDAPTLSDYPAATFGA